MNNEQIREEFEAWWESLAEPWDDSSSKAAAWEGFKFAWQASRKTLKIQLPEPYKADVTPQAQAWNRCLDACRSVLFSVGVKTR